MPLAAVDAAWLHMDRATNRMSITAVLTFDGVLSKEELMRVLAERLPRARFRQRVEERGGWRRPRWVSARVDFAEHVVEQAWPSPGDERALEGVVASVASAPFDRDRPLWRAHLVTGEGRCAIVFRVHHCVADGLALVDVLLLLVDEHGAKLTAEVGSDREEPARSLTALVRRGALHGLTLARLLALPPDARRAWKKPLTPAKATAWTRPLPLADVKRVARAEGAHVTDVLLAGVAGALARVRPRARRRVRALVPAFLRRAGVNELGNRFGLVYVPLPLSVDDPLERVRALRKTTAKRKGSVDAVVALEILGALGRLSRRLEDIGVAIFSSKASAMITSVPGPAEPLHILGRELVDVIAFGPAAGSIGLTAGLFSYRGHVRVAFAIDPALDVEARALADAFEAELATLQTR